MQIDMCKLRIIRKARNIHKRIIFFQTKSIFHYKQIPHFFLISNNILNVSNIHDYTVSIFMYKNVDPDRTTLFTHFFSVIQMSMYIQQEYLRIYMFRTVKQIFANLALELMVPVSGTLYPVM